MKRSFIKLINGLIKLIGPFIYIILLATLNGTLGFLLSMNITIFAGITVVKFLGCNVFLSYHALGIIIVVSGIMRGILRYVEQYSNHYIAFRILQILRNKIFTKVSNISIEEYEGKSKGDMVNMFETDVEALEVFYAHTISPVLIAILTSTIVMIFIGIYASPIISLYYFIAYIIIGLIIPIIYYKNNKNNGINNRKELASFNSYYLDSINGYHQIKGLNLEKERTLEINKRSESLNKISDNGENINIRYRNITNSIIIILNLCVILLSIILYKTNIITNLDTIVVFMTLTCSFGSVLALAQLPQNLANVFSSANRVLDLFELEEEKDEGRITDFHFNDLEVSNVTFKYNNVNILNNLNLNINKNDIIGIYGDSGSGKSTLLKLIMHYYDVNSGNIKINGIDINDYKREALYDKVALFSQDSYLFKDTILNNLLIAKADASSLDIDEALKKANAYDLVYGLKNGLNTKINDLSDNLSQGEIQRIALARVFLRKPELLLLDEFTANIDPLNEGIIIKSLLKHKEDMTIIVVSHKESTLNMCDKKYRFKDGVLYGS